MKALLTAFDTCTQIRLGHTPTGLTWAVLVQIMLAGEMVYTFLLLYTVRGRCLSLHSHNVEFARDSTRTTDLVSHAINMSDSK